MHVCHMAFQQRPGFEQLQHAPMHGCQVSSSKRPRLELLLPPPTSDCHLSQALLHAEETWLQTFELLTITIKQLTRELSRPLSCL
jgi:hypothetical protein